jgi:beta-xylosidase
MYQNPIIHADYSDPDVIRVGSDYYMTASSFNAIPGLPILHSKDLVNWRIINHALKVQKPLDVFSKPQHGNGVWAPSIRYHNGEFYIYYGDPDYGIYMTKTRNPSGDWSEPILVKEAKGWIDPCPLWDDDGNVYLVHALAGSRAGLKSVLLINRMNREGTTILDDGTLIFDGHEAHPTIEGPKFYKRNGFYYIFAPAGGVATGWQTVLRSRNIYGPYEAKIVMEQGSTPINGPHQGAWINTVTGEDWFIHFQDKGAYGRVVHLQPMKWQHGFPVIGNDPDGDGKGEPVLALKKPNVGKSYPRVTPQESDEFGGEHLGLQWQWHANPQFGWAFPRPHEGVLRLNAMPLPISSLPVSSSPEEKPNQGVNFWDVPNLLLQKFPAPEFTATTKLTFTPRTEGEKTGLVVMGLDYAYIGLTYKNGKIILAQSICLNADKQGKEIESAGITIENTTVYLRARIAKDAQVQFFYSLNGEDFQLVGAPFKAKEGKWIGAKIGLFSLRTAKTNDAGNAEFDWFRLTR